MATINGTQVGFFTIGAYNVLGSRDSVDCESESSQKDRTPLGQAPIVMDFTGIERAKIAHSGWMDTATGSIVDALLKSNRSRTAQIVAIGDEGNTLGVGCVCMAGGLTGSYKRGVKVDDFTRVEGAMVMSGAIDDQAVILAPLAARADDWSTTYYDSGASSTAGLAAYLVITSLTLGGFDDVVIKIEHSADHSTWADLVTFTAATGITSERKTVASGGTINRYLRVSCSYTGSGADETVTALVCAERY